MANGTPQEYFDIIFAGGGTTACVTAGRLAAADRSLRILLLETGPHIRNNPTLVQPARYLRNLANDETGTFTFHAGKPSPALNGRTPIIASGKCVGGGSGVNFMMYTRGSASDYDDWEALGNPGWGSKDLIPLASKVETLQGVDLPNHGTSGPIKISPSGLTTNVGQALLDVAAEYDNKRGFTRDSNVFGPKVDRYSPWFKYIDGENGTRSDAAHHFIYNQDQSNKNLVVRDRRRVTRVLFDGTKAVGVEYIDETPERPSSVSKALASRLVVLSGGAFGSPAILERSGIGSRVILENLKIPVLVDLPGVGENYRDHNRVFTQYYASDDAETLDDISRGTEEDIKPYLEQWLKDGKGLMAHNGIDAGIKIRPDERDLVELGPEFAHRWEIFFKDAPDKPVMWMGVFSGYTGTDPTAPRGKYLSTACFTAYPVSVGRVHIASQDPYVPLDFDPGYLNEPEDLTVLRWTYKHTRELVRRMKYYRGGLPNEHPKFPEGSEAAKGIGRVNGPDDIDSKKIRYTKEDDRAIDEYNRQTLETTWHSMGTCAIKPRAMNGVVDPHLNVYGVQNLKVADMSIAPLNVAANTYNTSLIIGEKAAIIIARELSIQGVGD